MKKYILLISFSLFLLFTLSLSSSVHAQTSIKEFLIYDEVFTFTESEHGFHLFPYNSGAPANWQYPQNFNEGQFHVRIESRTLPTNTHFRLSTCIWQDNNDREACSTQWNIPSRGTYTFSDSPAYNWWNNGNPIDFSRPHDFQYLGLVLWNEYGENVSDWVDGSIWNNYKDLLLPMTLRLTVVAVANGSTFSGWNNYIGGSTPTPAPTTPFLSPTAAPTIDPSVRQLLVDCGSSSRYVDSQGYTWEADQGFTGGNTYNVGDSVSIANTNDPSLYRTERYGMSGYNLPVPNGNYNVRLHFAETFWSSANQRLFTATVEEVPVVGSNGSNLDIFTEAGGINKAWVASVPVTVTDGTMTIDFSASKDNATITAIEIRRQASETVAGDVNGDGSVNGTDLLQLLGKYGTLGTPGTLGKEDTNTDGKVNILDAGIVIKNWGT